MGNNDSKPITAPAAQAPLQAATPVAATPSVACSAELDRIKSSHGSVLELIPLLSRFRSSPPDTECIIRAIITRLDKYKDEKKLFRANRGYNELGASISANLKDTGVAEWGVRCIIVGTATDDANNDELMDEVLDICGKAITEATIAQMPKNPAPVEWALRCLNLMAAGSVARKDALAELGACEVVVKALNQQVANAKVAEWGTRFMIVMMDGHEGNTVRLGNIGGADIAGNLLAKHVSNADVVQWASRCLILLSYTHTDVALKICSSGLLKCVATALANQTNPTATEWITRLVIVLADSTDVNVNNKVHTSMGRDGVCDALVKSLSIHLNNPTVANWNVKALLITGTDNADKFGKCGAARVISQCIESQVHNAETVEYAIRAAVVLCDVAPQNKQIFGDADYINSCKLAITIHQSISPKVVEWAVRSLIVVTNDSPSNQRKMVSTQTCKAVCDIVEASINNDAILEWCMRCIIITANGSDVAQAALGNLAGPCIAKTLAACTTGIRSEERRSAVLEWSSRALIVLANENESNSVRLCRSCSSALLQCLRSEMTFSVSSIEWSVRSVIVFAGTPQNSHILAEQDVGNVLCKQLISHQGNPSIAKWCLVGWTVLAANPLIKASIASDKHRNAVNAIQILHQNDQEIQQYALEALNLIEEGRFLPKYVPPPQQQLQQPPQLQPQQQQQQQVPPTSQFQNLQIGGPQVGGPNTAVPYSGSYSGMPMAQATVVSIGGSADVNYTPAVVMPPTAPTAELHQKDIDTIKAFLSEKCGLGSVLSTDLATKLVIENNICTIKMMKRKQNSGALEPVWLKFGLDSDSIEAIREELSKIE